MKTQDRRERMSLDRAYEVYCTTIKLESSADLHAIVEALKTVQHALNVSSKGAFKLTDRLWYRIRQALFDKLLTGYSNELVVFDESGAMLSIGDPISESGSLRINPEGSRRADDRFHIPVIDLHEMTLIKLSKVRDLHGANLRKEHFADLHIECAGGACMLPANVVFGHERLREETKHGRRLAYTEWWDLYWRAYCTPDEEELSAVRERMAMLESIWGNLSKHTKADVA